MGFADIAELLEQLDPAVRRVFIEVFRMIEEQMVTKAEFRELRDAVKELAEAQKRTEQRLNELTQRVNELAEAQKKTEQRLDELAQRVNELAEAQKKTELMVAKLIGEQKKIKEQVGGLSHTVGYVLEDRAYRGLPPLLERDFGLKVEMLKRDYVEVLPGRYEEINIIGYGFRGSERVWILGDCKTQLKKRDVDNFLKLLKRVEHMFVGEKIVVFATYQASPQVRRYVEQKGCKIYFSYEFPL